MCVMACTFTACTTRSAKPWPSESSQKAGVRSASRAVKSRVGRLRAPPQLLRRPAASGSAVDGLAVVLGPAAHHHGERQPDHDGDDARAEGGGAPAEASAATSATSGTEMPPSARPIDSDGKRARAPALEPVDERDVDREEAAQARAERDDDERGVELRAACRCS